jgi:hypothetical protein
MSKERTRVKYDGDYSDSVLINMIGEKQFHELVEVRRAWLKGGRCASDDHREVIRRLFDKGISKSIYYVKHAYKNRTIFEGCSKGTVDRWR